MNETTGTLVGIGVGPGDPELITLKAIRALRSADVLCLPQAEKARCRAYQIALGAVPELAEKPCLCCSFPMTREAAVLRSAHLEIWRTVRERLLAGETAAFLMIGDPAVYSTFTYIAKLAAAENFRVETVSGVTSFQAAAAALDVSLCEGDEPLHLCSGQQDVDPILACPGTKVILKCGRRIGEIKARLLPLEASGRVRVLAVSDCGLETERRYNGAASIPENAGYMTTILVREVRES